MKLLTTVFFSLFINLLFSQNTNQSQKFRQIHPDIRLGLLDKENSSKSLKIKSLDYNDIPKYLDFKGTVVEAVQWSDSLGDNILIQTVTGAFKWKDYNKDESVFLMQDKSELYAYLFHKSKTEKEFSKAWRIYDYTKCFGVDMFTGFTPNATTITDLDKNGISEISIPYVSICRGGVDPGTMKIIMYEGNTKYALRGLTMLMCKGKTPYGGKFTESANLKSKTGFKEFLVKQWLSNRCEENRYY